MAFRIFKPTQAATNNTWRRSFSEQGVHIGQAGNGEVLSNELLSGYIAQLVDDGLAEQKTEDGVLISWTALYTALRNPDYDELPTILNLPPFTESNIELQSSNALTDNDFSIVVAGWRADQVQGQPTVDGAMLVRDEQRELMRPAQWELFSAIRSFARRTPEQRNGQLHREAWGRIRTLALAADARLDDFLRRSVVLTPERLNIELRKSASIADDSVIEITPDFAGAPHDWLERFDNAPNVLDRYDIVTPEGIVQVLITPEVKTVLQEIKRLPARRVAGARAQAFIRNPYAALGSDAQAVIDEEQFAAALENAGIQYERFVPLIERNADGCILRTGLLIETATKTGSATSEKVWLDDESLEEFIAQLEQALSRNFQFLGWHGYDLELQGDTPAHLIKLKEALEHRRRPVPMIAYAEVHDLSAYSTRIEGIGIEKPYYSPYIARKNDDEGWIPTNIDLVITYMPEGGTELVGLPVNEALLSWLQNAVERAQETGESAIRLPELPQSMAIDEARNIVNTFGSIQDEVGQGVFIPPNSQAPESNSTGTEPRAVKTLILRANIGTVDYGENRQDALKDFPTEPEQPHCLNPNFSLLPHQLQGLAWLQRLYRSQNKYQVRGAVLADDMGLGKTYQLLAFMAWLAENDPNIAPMLVVAPVSLLENWKEEAGKFIQPNVLPILTAYGESLAPLRVPRAEIDARLRDEDGLVRFLKPNWVGNAKVVLTTYETLRDFEFSFAAERWSVMVCDEAQRIKNPSAMVTRAAKKQNVGFRVACTGTPVENTLADLWCLFDFVQPGLLGALNDFGQRYRKPIEARSDEERARVEELRDKISPQILRRTKTEVAKNLPKKIVVDDCKQLVLSDEQRKLYSWAITSFNARRNQGTITPFKNHLDLLLYLRIICTDPKRHGLTAFRPETLNDYRSKAPKLDWLLKQLADIKKKNEKAIIFCEFRHIQRLLQHYIEQMFNVRADIINGEANAAAGHSASRQKRIKAFQDQVGFGVIILSPIAVGFGVNIQAANHVIHYTRTWNPAKEDQATDRAYRIGQTKDVYVYCPIVTANDFSTFDFKLDQLLTKKRELANDMLNGSGELTPGDFNITEVVPANGVQNFDENIVLDHILRMEARHFEGLAAALWGKQGFVTYCTSQSGDHGVDAVAISDNQGVLIQVKTSSIQGNRLGWSAISEVVAGEAYYRRKHSNVNFQKVAMTNQFFNDDAIRQAELNGVKLIGQTQLVELLQQFPTTMLDVERVLYSEWGS